MQYISMQLQYTNIFTSNIDEKSMECYVLFQRRGQRTSNDSSETRSAERHKTSGGYGTVDGSEILHTVDIYI